VNGVFIEIPGCRLVEIIVRERICGPFRPGMHVSMFYGNWCPEGAQNTYRDYFKPEEQDSLLPSLQDMPEFVPQQSDIACLFSPDKNTYSGYGTCCSLIELVQIQCKYRDSFYLADLFYEVAHWNAGYSLFFTNIRNRNTGNNLFPGSWRVTICRNRHFFDHWSAAWVLLIVYHHMEIRSNSFL